MKNAVKILTRNATTSFSNKHINHERSKIYLQRELLALGKTRYISFPSKFFLWAFSIYICGRDFLFHKIKVKFGLSR